MQLSKIKINHELDEPDMNVYKCLSQNKSKKMLHTNCFTSRMYQTIIPRRENVDQFPSCVQK